LTPIRKRHMATLLHRLGRAAFRRRGLVVVIWLVALAALGAAALLFKGPTSGELSMPGTESQRALDILKRDFPEASGATGTTVVAGPEGRQLLEEKAAIAALVQEVSALPGVIGAVDPFQAQALSPDGRYALIQVQFAERAYSISDELRA